MRRLCLLLASSLLFVFPGAAHAAWDPAGAPNAAFAGATDLRFDPSGQGTLRTAPGTGYISRTTDNGASWGTLQSYVNTPGSNFEYGTDADGNRAWAWAFTGTKARFLRTGPNGVPASTGTAEFTFPSAGGSQFKIAVNAAGDALVVRDVSGTGNLMVAFWKAGEAAPTSAQTLTVPIAAGSASGVIPFIDPSGSATVAWTAALSGEHTFQSSSSDASQSGSFSAPVEFSDASTVSGGQGADGRGVLILSDGRAAPTNSYGSTSTATLNYAARAPGGVFPTPSLLDGDDDHVTVGITNVAVSPGGGMIVGWQLAINEPGGDIPTCEVAQTKRQTRVAAGTIGSGGGLVLTAQTISGPGHAGSVPKVAAGPDGRVAAAWQETVSCPAAGGLFAAYSPNAGTPSLVESPPFIPYALAFNACGAMYALGSESGTLKGYSKQAGTPLDCAGTSNPPGGGTSNPPASNPIVPPLPSPTKLTATLGSAKVKKGGTATVSVGVSGAAAIGAVALFKSKPAIKITKTATGAGNVTFSFKLKGAALKELKKKKKLKLKVKFTITPVTGAAPAPITKAITFVK